jgi:hypothetical protein
MSALDQNRTSKNVQVMPALPPKADIGTGPVSLDQSPQGLAHRVIEIGVGEWAPRCCSYGATRLLVRESVERRPASAEQLSLWPSLVLRSMSPGGAVLLLGFHIAEKSSAVRRCLLMGKSS